jgi:hypothetical protein
VEYKAVKVLLVQLDLKELPEHKELLEQLALKDRKARVEYKVLLVQLGRKDLTEHKEQLEVLAPKDHKA